MDFCEEDEYVAICAGYLGLRDGYIDYSNNWRDAELGRGFTNAFNVSKMETRSGETVEKELDYGKDVSTAMCMLLSNEGSTLILVDGHLKVVIGSA